MPRTLFPNGIPTQALSARARSLAEELDKSSLIARKDPGTKGDAKIDAEEIRSALSQVDNFDPETQAAVKELAAALGVETTPAVPLKLEWQDRQTERFNTPIQAVTMGDKAVVLDGSSSEEYPILRAYDPARDQWSKLDLPQKFHGYTKGSSIAGDKNGLYFTVASGNNDRPVPWVLRWDANQRQWQDLPGNPTPASNPATASLNGNLVVAGGADHGFGGKPVATVQMFDATKNQWQQLPDLPVARRYASAVEVDGKLVVVGGQDAAGNRLDRVDVYDPKTGQWQNPALRIGTQVMRPSVWAEGTQLHVTGGNAGANSGGNSNHDVLDLATGKISDGEPLPAASLNLNAARVGDRTFVFGEERTQKQASFTKELAAKPGQGHDANGAGDTINNVTNNTFNLQVLNVDLTTVSNTVNNFVDVDTRVTQNVTINDTRLSLAPISISGLEPRSDTKEHGGFDPDNDFFMRTQSAGKPLVRTGSDAQGQRFLVGLSADGRSAVPKNRADLFAFHAGSRTLIPFKSDAQGQFAIPLPAGLSGPVQIFSMKDGVPSGSATLDIP